MMGKKGTALAIALAFVIIVSIAAGALMMFARGHYGALITGADTIGKMHAAEAGFWHAHRMLYNIRQGSTNPFAWGKNPGDLEPPVLIEVWVGKYKAEAILTYQDIADNYKVDIKTVRHAMGS